MKEDRNTNRRLKGVVAQIPMYVWVCVVYHVNLFVSCFGNIAWWQGPTAEPTKTHKWTVFVRGCQNEDLSHFIKKVVFTLHSSFDKPKRGTYKQRIAAFCLISNSL